MSHYFSDPKGITPTYDFTSPYGDEISLPIPEGSIKAYVEKHIEDYSSPDAHIIVFAKYHRPPGEKTPVPPGLLVERQDPNATPTLNRLSDESDKRYKEANPYLEPPEDFPTCSLNQQQN